MISVLIPAHNEKLVIARLLEGLLADARPGEFDIVVVCNGCTDRTAEIAASFSDVRVVETPLPSKAAALRLGDATARGFPRVYVDADVQMGTKDLKALSAAVEGTAVLAAGPRRSLSMEGASWLVRWYYSVWLRLPAVRSGLFGRGAIAVSQLGHARIAALPEVLSDDLAMSASFAQGERRIVADASVTIYPPRGWGDLLRRRVRAMTGVAQLQSVPGLGLSEARTSFKDLVWILAKEPSLAAPALLFSGTAVLSRALANRRVRRGDFSTWLRDESSRPPPT